MESTTDEKDSDAIQQLQADSKKLRDEFDSQRAKFKELFLQKEDELIRKNKENEDLQDKLAKLQRELDDAKSQLVVTNITLESSLEAEKRKAESEIASLQRLIHETVEESSSSKTVYDTEIRKLQKTIQVLENEMGALKSERHSVQEQSSGLVPSVMLSAVTKTLARKLGADVFSSQDGESYQKIENDDDHTKEDAEVLRSLVVPLEEEIKALKDKLRATDRQLQKCKQCRHIPEQEVPRAPSNQSLASVGEGQLGVSVVDENKKTVPEQSQISSQCDMCRNYEAQLVKEQQKVSELQSKVSACEKAAEKHREELLKEIGFRKDMEEKWNEKKEEHKQQVAELSRRTECAEQDLKEAQLLFKQTCNEVEQRLKDLIEDRENVAKELTRLQKENESLAGKYTAHSQELQSEIINLPNTVEELQEVVLKTIQDLIIAKVGKEATEEQMNSLRSDIMLLKDQITNDQQEKESLENSLATEINTLKKQLHVYEKEKRHFLLMENKLTDLQEAHQKVLNQLEETNRAKRN
ncbi:rab GTPase-binding effector protein 1 isoform X2 [Agrilus planipennis]|uniref:Rab GTPase-binding effector protein 1 isoform X2 n=1 Tax=Agrilus planipennis TaxID=224129 RepID=A0A1W4XA62_AGRPL|nr:rab GTPase-binding effector protein 1 isoform X2 [Agrilus planipennis]